MSLVKASRAPVISLKVNAKAWDPLPYQGSATTYTPSESMCVVFLV